MLNGNLLSRVARAPRGLRLRHKISARPIADDQNARSAEVIPFRTRPSGEPDKIEGAYREHLARSVVTSHRNVPSGAFFLAAAVTLVGVFLAMLLLL